MLLSLFSNDTSQSRLHIFAILNIFLLLYPTQEPISKLGLQKVRKFTPQRGHAQRLSCLPNNFFAYLKRCCEPSTTTCIIDPSPSGGCNGQVFGGMKRVFVSLWWATSDDLANYGTLECYAQQVGFSRRPCGCVFSSGEALCRDTRKHWHSRGCCGPWPGWAARTTAARGWPTL